MKISLKPDEIRRLAKEYAVDDTKELKRMSQARSRGYMTKDDLFKMAKWKWPGGRVTGLVSESDAQDIEEITRVSFAASSERLRIGALLSLKGVDWPMASAILHFTFPDRYPILDFRVMASVGEPKSYNHERWQDYCELCRRKSKELSISIRDLDRALWGAHADANKKRASA